MNNPTVSLILPFYNQGDHLEKVILNYIEILKQFPKSYEMILVINGSSDNSYSIALNLANRYSNIIPIEIKSAGWGRAIKAGINKSRGDILCYTGTARTRPKDLLLILQKSLANPNSVVKAHRVVRPGYNKSRKFASSVYNFLCHALFKVTSNDIDGKPVVFPRKFNKLLTLQDDDIIFDTEFMVMCHMMNYEIIEIPTEAALRFGGHSTTNILSALKMYSGIFKLWIKIKF